MARYVVFALLLVSVTVFAKPPQGKYKAIVDKMLKLESDFPAFAHVYSIGQNDEETDLYSLRISTTPKEMDPFKVGHLLVATHHGDESGAPILAVGHMEGLLKRYSSDELWKGAIGNIEWTIVPVLNVSGYNSGQRREYGVDPNRDYPGPCISNPGGKLKSIQRIMELLKSRTFSGNVTVHGYMSSFTYPWGVDVDNTFTLDHNFFQQVTQKAAAINHYQHGTSTDIVYPADGTYEDFVYWKYGHWSLLVELANGSSSDIQSTVQALSKYYDELPGAPSTHNQFTAHCLRSRVDLAIE